MNISSKSPVLQPNVEEVMQRVKEKPAMNSIKDRQQVAENLWKLFSKYIMIAHYFACVF